MKQLTLMLMLALTGLVEGSPASADINSGLVAYYPSTGMQATRAATAITASFTDRH